MTKVCRLCLSKLQRGSKYFNVNAVESFTGFMPYRDQLTTLIPEMALDMIPNPVICNNCRSALKFSYDFKAKCLLVEKKVREYAETRPTDSALDLNEIDSSDIPKTEKNKIIPLEPPTSNNQASMLSALLLVQKEVVLPSVNDVGLTPTKRPTKAAAKQVLQDREGSPYMCSICDMKFNNLQALKFHKQQLHEEDYMCNFCSQSFKSLQYLRKHNNVCQKSRVPIGANPVLTKRPHLPTKAKNHLKRWLFRHTDHPYPTDLEKQQLMKETNLSLLQVENWFINARRRILADLTKLKNLRGYQMKKKRSQDRLELTDYEEILEADAEKLLEEFDTTFEEGVATVPSPTPLRAKVRGPRGRRRIVHQNTVSEAEEEDPLNTDADIVEADIAARSIKMETMEPDDVEEEEEVEEEIIEELVNQEEDENNRPSISVANIKMEIEVDER